MPLVISTKTILRAAGFAAALSTLGGFAYGTVEFSKPLIDSGPPPFPSRVELTEAVAGLTQALKGIQMQNAEQARQDAARDRLLAATRQQVLESLLYGAEAQRPMTTVSRSYICNLIDQIDQARAVNRLPPIKPCQ